MKSPKLLRKLVLILFIGGLSAAGSVALTKADSGSVTTSEQPGSVNDPIVTKSYVDQKIKQSVKEEMSSQTVTQDDVKKQVQAETASIQEQINLQVQKELDQMKAQLKEQLQSSKIIQLKPGQALYGKQGTEIIVRSGKAVMTTKDNQGISDLTDGKDITSGQSIGNNHLMLVPREGRGIQHEPSYKGDLFVIVTGEYTIEQSAAKEASTAETVSKDKK